MKKLLYIGNQLSEKGKTSTTVDTLSLLLRNEAYSVFTASNKSNKLLRLLDMLYSIFKYSNKVDYVLIDTYSTKNFYYAYLTSQLCRLFKLKYISVLHGGNLPNRLKDNSKLSKAIFNNSYTNIAPSDYIRLEFEKQGYTNLTTIPNTINIDNYTFTERNYETIKLLWVRSFSKIYNPFLAIRILKTLKDEGQNVSLCMVGPEGDGSCKETQNLAKELNVEVKFTGKLPKKEWIDLSRDYNIFINTTNFDNMPVSVIEAMALGLPIVSTNVGGMPFLIDDGENGVLVNPDDVTEFINAIKKVSSSQKETLKMTKSARSKVEQFDWEIVKQKWSNLFN